MRWIVLAGWIAAPVWAGEPLSPAEPAGEIEPPKCEKANRSEFWPEEANNDARAAVRLAREGKLLICTRGAWRYKWRPVTMNIRAETEARAKGKK